MNRKNKWLAIVTLVVFLGMVSFIASPGWSWESQDPQLAKDWAKMVGFNAKDLVGKVAPDIKPGMVIDSSNYKDYPGLKKLLPKSLYDRFDPGSYAPLAPMKIAETDQYHISRGFMEKTLESAKTCKLAEDGLTLVGYAGGFPFLNPKNGNELMQYVDNSYLGDTFAMRPMRLRLYGKKNKPERELRQNLNVVRYKGCTDWRPDGLKPNPDGVNYVVSGVFIYPRDLSGTSYVRKRFMSADNPDEFLLYIPSMRRIRRMSGRDSQDPLFGSDLVWDDYNVCWLKLSQTEFPNDYKILGESEMLLPTFIDYNWPDDRTTAGYTDYRVDESGDQIYLHYGSWQRRPVWTLEVISKDSAYLYSKRIIIVDRETGLPLQTDLYDQAGRLWRSWVRDYNLSRKGEGVMEDLIDIVDHTNRHRTILDFKGHMNPRWMGAEYSDVRFLSRKGK
ncbi:MAG: DUF1329 domain-containing protein [Deltaproteobacteria bacterium]|nr:DUF1329 domain-containing protein [Deltaproteobacteria bacterium]